MRFKKITEGNGVSKGTNEDEGEQKSRIKIVRRRDPVRG
jgi:hypothetical protein